MNPLKAPNTACFCLITLRAEFRDLGNVFIHISAVVTHQTVDEVTTKLEKLQHHLVDYLKKKRKKKDL